MEKNRKLRIGRKLLWVLPVCGLVILMLACGALYLFQGGHEKEEITLRFLMFGTEPEGMEDVLEEFHRRTQDTLGIRVEMEWVVQASEYKVVSDIKLSAGENYDLVFDANWIHLYEMQARGAYLDLSPYLNNPEYPGLYAAFSETALENNRVNGEQCALPLFRTYGTGIPCVYYRRDLALKYGISSINSVEELEKYMQTLQAEEEGMIPLLLNGARGFYHFNPQSDPAAPELSRRFVYPMSIGDVTVIAQLDESMSYVEALGMMGDEESFAGFAEGMQFNFLIGRLDAYRNWNKYCEDDVLNRTDQAVMFQTGQGGAYISTLDDYEEVDKMLRENIPEASLGVYIINSGVRDMEDHVLSTDYRANNYLCIPEFSEHIEETVLFLDWLFASAENHDLFEHGIEGVHWKAVGEDRYKALEDAEGNYYLFPGYTLTWNSRYVRFPADMPEDILAYKEYELKESTFYKKVLAGFQFDDSAVQAQMVKVESILNRVWPALRNGILDNPGEVLRETVKEAKQYGLTDILEELQKQLDAYLSTRQN